MDKIKELMDKMTFEEKAKMLSGVSNMDISGVERLNIATVALADGPHGVRDEGNYESNCTGFPCLSALGATWNRDMARLMGQGIAKDCIKENKAMILGPGVNIKRIDVCGRNFEYFSEDPYLSGELAAEYINGVQEYGVGACIKHFAVNNQEVDRLYINSEVDERTLMEIYLKAFKIAIEKSNPAAVMTAVNKVNGILCSENKYLLSDILKGQWKYKGFVMSDWGCSKSVAKSIKAGLDLQMPQKPDIVEQVLEAYNNKQITIEEIDDAVYRILKFVMEYKPREYSYDRKQQHIDAKKIEEEAIVLLKNEDNLLPITKEKYKKIAVIGEYAVKPVIAGCGSSMVFTNSEWIDNPLSELKKILGNDVEIDYIPLYSTNRYYETSHFNMLSSIVDKISQYDLIVMFVGRQFSVETEGTDRISSHLDPYYEFFIKRFYPLNSKIILIVQSGGAFLPLSWQHKVKGIVQMWLGGESAGGAIANVLCGKVNPSGKLSETFPYKTRTDIDYPGDGYKVSYDEKCNVGYRYYDKHLDEIWFPFGHGLSYTRFEYRNMSITHLEDGLSISVDIENIGEFEGKEVVQLYYSDVKSTMTKPKKELCGFEKINLKPLECKTVKFNIKYSDLAYFNTCLKKWVVEPGVFAFYIGSSSVDIRLTDTFRVITESEYTIEYNAEQIMG